METQTSSGWLSWLREATPHERKTLLAGSLGWMLDAFDVMLYSMVLAHLLLHFQEMDQATAGLLNTLTLLASALGGALFGWFADRFGRTRALMASVLIYSVSSGACGMAQSVWQLGLFRLLLGLGMGGEWTAGATLVAESWRPQHRAKALALMQSSWAIGEGLAALTTGFLLSYETIQVAGSFSIPAWRAVFFVGVLPALLVFWIRRGVEEPEVWKNRSAQGHKVPLRELLRPGIRRNALVVTAMNTAVMFGYWGLFTWMPAFLALPVERGGRGLDITSTTLWLLLMGVGKWFGYVLFGYVADGLGRRAAYLIYLVMAGLLVLVFFSTTSVPLLLLVAPLVAFFGTGHYSGFGAVASELFPTEIRGAALGLTYNIGRGAGALAPLLIGALAGRFGLGGALLATSAAFLLAAGFAALLPETRGTTLS